jgi:hypothetical protein
MKGSLMDLEITSALGGNMRSPSLGSPCAGVFALINALSGAGAAEPEGGLAVRNSSSPPIVSSVLVARGDIR